MSQSETNGPAGRRARDIEPLRDQPIAVPPWDCPPWDCWVGPLAREAAAVEREARAVELEARAVVWEAYAEELEAGGRPFLWHILRDLLRQMQLLLNLCARLEQEVVEGDPMPLIDKLRMEIQNMQARLAQETGLRDELPDDTRAAVRQRGEREREGRTEARTEATTESTTETRSETRPAARNDDKREGRTEAGNEARREGRSSGREDERK